MKKIKSKFSKKANGGNINTTDKGWEFIPYGNHQDTFRDGGLTADTKFNNSVMPWIEAHRDGGLTSDTKFNNGVMPYMMSPMYTGGMMVVGNAPFKEFTGTLGDVPIAGRTNMKGFKNGGLTSDTKFNEGMIPLIQSYGDGGQGPDYGKATQRGARDFSTLDEAYEAYKQRGYTGPKDDIGQIQDWLVANEPKRLSNYLDLAGINNQGKSLYPGLSFSQMSPDQKFNSFKDKKWDYRLPNLWNDPLTPGKITPSTPTQGDPTKVNFDLTSQDWGSKDKGRSGFGLGAYPVPIPDLGEKIPISYAHINPNLVPYRPGSNEGELSEINRTTRGLSRFLPRTTEGVGEAANLQANALGKISDSFGKLYNENQRQQLGIDETNQRELTDVDKYNTNNFLGQDKYRMERDYNILTQGRQDAQDAQGRLDRNNQFQNTANWYNKTLNPLSYYDSQVAFSPEQAYTQVNSAEKSKQYTRDSKGRITSTDEKDSKPTVRNGGRIKSKLPKIVKKMK